jgi:hypothetical protein
MYSPITGFHKAIIVTTNDDIVVLKGEEKIITGIKRS